MAEVLKRVAASGYDTVEVVDCKLTVNGRVAAEAMFGVAGPECGGDFETVVVPDGHLFLLGDNWAGHRTAAVSVCTGGGRRRGRHRILKPTVLIADVHATYCDRRPISRDPPHCAIVTDGTSRRVDHRQG